MTNKQLITRNDIILDNSQQKDEKLFDFITGKEIANKQENREAKIPFGEELGLPRKNDLKPFKELSKRFETIHNYIYANEGLRNDETFDEILRLLFIKIMDEKDIASNFVQSGVSDEEWDLITNGKEKETKFWIQK